MKIIIGVSMLRKLSFQDMMDLIEGATILGCGGGGDPATAEGLVEEAFQKGREFSLMDPNQMREDDWVCILSYFGGGIEPKEKSLVEGLPQVWKSPIEIAVKELASYLGIEFQAYLPSEIGAGNTIIPMLVASIEGKPILDGDAAGGRAKPEMVISTTYLLGIPVTPLAIATLFGDSMLLKESINEERIERICRYLARASGGRIAVARCPTQGRNILPAVHRHSVSLALRAGHTIRMEKDNPVEALCEVLRGSIRFRGVVESFSREEKDGFMWGEIILKGKVNFDGEYYKVWFKNENLIGWRNGRIDITCPEAIAIVDSHKATGLYNWGNHFYEGREVSVIGIPAAGIWKTEKGLEIFGPRHFGFDFSHSSGMRWDESKL